MKISLSNGSLLTILLVCIFSIVGIGCKQNTANAPQQPKTTTAQKAKAKFQFHHKVRKPFNGITPETPTLILLHGYGSNEDDLFGLAQHMSPEWLVVCPNAPIQIQDNNRHSWYPLNRNADDWSYDAEAFIAIRDEISKYIDQVNNHFEVDKSKVVLGGFSQGAILSLATGLKYPEQISGIVSLSGQLYPEVKSDMATYQALSNSKIFISHGLSDDVLPCEPMQQTAKELQENGLNVSAHWYEGRHSISGENFRDLLKWLLQEYTS